MRIVDTDRPVLFIVDEDGRPVTWFTHGPSDCAAGKLDPEYCGGECGNCIRARAKHERLSVVAADTSEGRRLSVEWRDRGNV